MKIVEEIISSRPTPSWWKQTEEEKQRDSYWRSLSGETESGMKALDELLQILPRLKIINLRGEIGLLKDEVTYLLRIIGGFGSSTCDVGYVLYSATYSLALERGFDFIEARNTALEALRRLMPSTAIKCIEHAKREKGLPIFRHWPPL